MVNITKELLESILELSKSAYPYEVGGVLLGSKDKIDDFVLTPSTYGPFYIVTRMHDFPIYANSKGSFHSHPSPNNKPSKADLNSFSKFGRNHLIIGYPYKLESVAAYDSTGKKQEIVIVWTQKKKWNYWKKIA